MTATRNKWRAFTPRPYHLSGRVTKATANHPHHEPSLMLVRRDGKRPTGIGKQ